MIIDWEKWMAEHHIKIGGNPNDNGTDAVKTGKSISGSQVETKGDGNVGKPSHCCVQKHAGN